MGIWLVDQWGRHQPHSKYQIVQFDCGKTANSAYVSFLCHPSALAWMQTIFRCRLATIQLLFSRAAYTHVRTTSASRLGTGTGLAMHHMQWYRMCVCERWQWHTFYAGGSSPHSSLRCPKRPSILPLSISLALQPGTRHTRYVCVYEIFPHKTTGKKSFQLNEANFKRIKDKYNYPFWFICETIWIISMPMPIHGECLHMRHTHVGVLYARTLRYERTVEFCALCVLARN